MNLATCIEPVLDEEKRARLCNQPAVTFRLIFGVWFAMCEPHATAYDAEKAKTDDAAKGGDSDA